MPKKSYNPRIQMTTDQRETVGRMILDEINASVSALSDLHDKISRWNDQYEGVLVPKDEPWPNCANLHIPLTQWQVDTIVSNIHSTVFGTDPCIHTEPLPGGDIEGASELEMWLRVLVERTGLRRSIGKQITIATGKHGTGILKLTQDKWLETVRAVKRDEGGISEVQEIERARTGPRMDYVPLRDFVICPAEALTVKEALGVGDRKRLRLGQIRRLEDVGMYEEGTTKQLGEEQSPPEDQPTEVQDTIGVQAGRHDTRQLDTYVRWEMIWALPLSQTKDGWKYDEKNGRERDCLVTLLGDKPIVARCILYPWFHNRRHYIPFRMLPREGEFWGRSICQMLESLQDEINTEHNQRADLRTIRLKPPLIAEKGSEIEDEHGNRQIEFAPGKVIWVDEKDAVTWMDPPQETPSSAQEEAMMVSYAERVLGVTEAKLGKPQAGEKTLGEVQIVETQGSLRFDDMVLAFQGHGDFHEGSGLQEVAYQLIGLSLQFADPEEVYRVLGDEGNFLEARKPQVEMEDAIGAYDYIPTGNSQSSNRYTRQQQAVMLHDRLIVHPLVQGHPVRTWHATKEMLDSFDVRNWRSLIGTEEEAQAQFDQIFEKLQADNNPGAGGGAPPGELDMSQLQMPEGLEIPEGAGAYV